MNEEEEKKGSSVSQKVDSARSNTKRLKDFFSKFKKSKLANKTAVKALAKILVSCGWVILIFIIVVGIIMFFLTMPGMVMEKLKGLFKAAADAWLAFWGEDTSTQFENIQIYNVLNYLDEMGYDLKGYGFVTEFLTDPKGEYDRGTIEGTDVPETERKSTKDGVIRDGDNKIITGVSDFIQMYLVSENYIYTIKNNNTVTEHWWEALGDHISSLFTDDLSNKRGMLVFFHDDGTIGGSTENAYDSFERGYIKFEDKKLLIKKGWTNSAMSYSLDGWTGRYGMPVDFLLTVHLATQMPDLAYDMASTFETEIKILLHRAQGSVFGSYNGTKGMIDSNVVEGTINAFQGGNFITRLWNNADNLNINAEEATKLIDLGIVPTMHNPKIEGAEETEGEIDTSCGCEISSDEGSTEIVTVGSDCEKFWKFALKHLKKPNEFNYDTYIPYIENVTRHWFRDVYFIINEDFDEEFVDYDYQYELITGERWTMYETDSNGDFVYYVMNEDGSTSDEIYTGKVISGEFAVTDENGNVQKDKDGNIITERLANRGEDGTLVVKKAKTINLANQYNDLGWDFDESKGIYSAYNLKEGDSDEYQEMYTDEEKKEKAGTGDDAGWKMEVLNNISVHVSLPSINQTGEGLRTETNPDIKKMFMSNNYFKYDGSRQRAEIIYALRKESGVEYGPIDDSELENTYNLTFPKAPEGKFTSEAEEGTYKLGDYVGNVSFQQDALNTFAMMENSHTLDSDYIYKDFKELVVELGYFDKEELTESKPKLLQWVVPDIGSAGYPDRSIDKREAEYGTMVHSKMDIEANEKNKIRTIIENMKVEEPEKGNVEEPVSALTPVNGIQQDSNTKSDDALLTNSSNVNFTNVKGSGSKMVLERVQESGVGYETVVKSGNVKYIHRYQGGQPYSDIHFTWAGEDNTLGDAACGLFACFNVLTGYGYDFDPVKDLSGFDWGATMAAVKTLMEEKGVTGQFIDRTDTATLDQALNEGRPAILLFAGNAVDKKGICWTTCGHFVALVGKDSSGNILTLDSAANCVERHDYPGTVDDMQPAFSPTAQIWIADEPPTGIKNSGGAYTGYEGNEAVVSPVTGILMEYGTYDEETAEENRENIDIKYGGLLEGHEFETEMVVDPETGEETTKIKYPSDKVGYAVIKVLDAETYKKLESKVENDWQSDSLVQINEKSINYDGKEYASVNKHIAFKEKTEELVAEDRNWSKMDETVYGYKEFVEQYEQFGIGGYYIYIDGFKCETVEEKEESEEGAETPETSEEGEENKKVIPHGEPLTIDSFKISESEVNDENYEPKTESLYEPDEVSKLVSESFFEKLKAESAIKADASIGITFNYDDKEVDEEGNSKTVTNEYILIKEGTVLGRTLTDYELLEGEDYRNGELGTYDEYVEAQKDSSTEESASIEENTNIEENPDADLIINKVPLVGNYLRLIMQEQNGDIVENIEDYMKLDEGDTSHTDLDYEFFFWSPYEGGPWGTYEKYSSEYSDAGGRSSVGSGPTIIEIDGDVAVVGNVSWSIAVGIAQWTNNSNGLNNLSGLCAYLSEFDPALSSLKDFANKDADFYNNNISSLKETWHNICQTQAGYDKMLEGQMTYIYEEEWLNSKNSKYKAIADWAKERPMALQGHIFSVENWGDYTYGKGTLLDYVSNSMSDMENINSLGEAAHSYGGSVGVAKRFNVQSQFCADIINGKITEEQLKEWIETKKITGVSPGYGEGTPVSFPVSAITNIKKTLMAFFNRGVK